MQRMLSDRDSNASAQRPRRAPRRLRRRWPKPRLTIAKILQWADEFHRQRGRWPHHFDGRITGAGEDTWSRINDALAQGYRGLTGKSSLARLLFLRRGVRSPRNVPVLSESQIIRWARAHHSRMRRWPTESSGPILSAPGETWAAIDLALARGTRGLPCGSSLARLLERHGFKKNPQNRPPLNKRQILDLADAFFRKHGHWPYHDSGAIESLPGQSWRTIDKALRRGTRGLAGGRTLASFLNQHRDIFEGKSRRSPRVREDKQLRLEHILMWGKESFRRSGTYPNRDSGPVGKAGGPTWKTIDSALKHGSRGLPGGSSLAKLFGDRRTMRRKR